MAMCDVCHAAMPVNTRRGRRILDTPCQRCGARALGAAHASCPSVYRREAYLFIWGAEAATLGQPRAEGQDAAWYAGYDVAASWSSSG